MKADLVEANGANIPAIGLGTWRLQDQACADAVQWAIEAGYRHIDTAARYENEAAVGAGIRASGLARDEVFITTKVWHSDLRLDDFRRSAEASLKRLGLSQVDLLLIHWPNSDVPLAESLNALAEAKRSGLTRHIGVSNFPARLLEQAVQQSCEPLTVNQCEYHPYLDQSRVRAACRAYGTAFTSYCPLGRGELTQEPLIEAIAGKYGKTPAQVVLRWHVQQPGTVAIPKSGNRQRIAENLNIFDFVLSGEEMRNISGLARPDGRMVRPAWDMDFEDEI
ncbi:aldo/keto reductase [Microvirga sp. TS319]|uniref:aldo/keto reductase n=1 Tax=Microvirga sp. TS319 TaxID=3241165 RepID=UPI00351A3FBD